MKKVFSCVMALLLIATLSVTVLAAPSDFVPSVQMKPGPSIVEQETIDGVPGAAIIVMPDGREVAVPEGSIVITPIGDKDKADDETKKALEDAFNKIQNAESLEDLMDGLQDILDQIANGTDVKDLIITDLFHVGLDGEYSELLEDGGELRVRLDGQDGLIAALKQNGDKWSAIYGDMFVDNGDGTYTLIIKDLGVYAFFRDVIGSSADYDDPDHASPQTGDMTWMLYVLPAVLVMIGFVCLAVAKKQKA